MFSKEINLKFEIDWKSIHLADIEWDVSLNKDNYSIDFVIQSYGMTDKIFKYKSVTNIEGLIKNNQLHPLTYKSKTKSTKQDVYANLTFSPDGQIVDFDISKELNDDQLSMQDQFINQYQFFTDPISQLVQYFLFQTDSNRMIVDGLNIYSLQYQNLSDEFFEENNPTPNQTQLILSTLNACCYVWQEENINIAKSGLISGINLIREKWIIKDILVFHRVSNQIGILWRS